MDHRAILQTEETLDPQDWEALRALAHRMIDDSFQYLQTLAERPVWTKTPEATIALSKNPLPKEGTAVEDVYEDFKTHIFPYTKGNIHPRFWSWVQGTGTMTGALADLLASVMNPNATIGDHAAMYIDRQVVDWCKQIAGFPADASGILLSGGSVANITAITVARNAFDAQIRAKGLSAAAGQLTMYGSVETHSCLQKAAEMIGIGAEHFRRIPVDKAFKIDLEALKKQIKADREAGFIPFCIVGNAGTVNTGAIDPLDDLSRICKEENLWFHIDGAYGALAILVPEFKDALKAVSAADSVAFDLHKWMYVPYEVGCALIRRHPEHRNAFVLQPNYLLSHERGLPAGPDPITNYGMELSRGFKALKVWMSIREHGIDKYARLIRQNIAQAFYLGEMVENAEDLELMTPVTMNIACFRFNPNKGLSSDELNAFNKEILMQLHERGIAAPSYTLLDGQYALRACIVNHRTTKKDLEAMVEGVLQIGRSLLATTPA